MTKIKCVTIKLLNKKPFARRMFLNMYLYDFNQRKDKQYLKFLVKTTYKSPSSNLEVAKIIPLFTLPKSTTYLCLKNVVYTQKNVKWYGIKRTAEVIGKNLVPPFIPVVPVIPVTNTVAASMFVKPKLPFLNYNPVKLNTQLKNDALLQSYIPIYEKHGLLIPYPIITKPSNGISGSFTLPIIERTSLANNDEDYIQSHAYGFMRYFITMYGGKPITSLENLISRKKQLFVEDSFINNYSYPEKFIQGNKSLFPIFQHWLSLDFYNYCLEPKNLPHPSNLNFESSKYWSMSKTLEIEIIKKTHAFKFSENRDEIRVMDVTNPKDLEFLDKYNPVIQKIAGQPHPEMVCEVLGINPKVIYTLETKIIGYPEQHLKLLSSYSSISPLYQGFLVAERFRGQLITAKCNPSFSKTSEILNKDIYQIIPEFENLIKKAKRGYININVFNETINNHMINFFNRRINTNTILDNNKSYLPSFIGRPFETKYEDNYFHSLQKENPEILKNMIDDISSTINFQSHFPTFKQLSHNYDMYESQLSIMLILKKYGMLENYYLARNLLLNADIHDL